MQNILLTANNIIRSFLKDEEGAQVVEYALIIAVISIALVIALSTITTDTGANFTSFIGRVRTCLTSANCI